MFNGRTVGLPYHHDALVLALIEGGLQRVQQSHLVIAVVCYRHAVDEQAVVVGLQVALAGYDLGYVNQFGIAGHQPRIATLGQDIELGAQVASFGDDDLGEQRQTRAVRIGVDAVDNIVGRMLFHQLT